MGLGRVRVATKRNLEAVPGSKGGAGAKNVAGGAWVGDMRIRVCVCVCVCVCLVVVCGRHTVRALVTFSSEVASMQ
jgi:hypothetical protein